MSLRQTTSKDNLFFFGDIANYSADEFVEALYHASNTKPAINKIQCDLAGKIITNSRIGLRKFRLFTVAVWIAGAGILLLLVVVAGKFFKESM